MASCFLQQKDRNPVNTFILFGASLDTKSMEITCSLCPREAGKCLVQAQGGLHVPFPLSSRVAIPSIPGHTIFQKQEHPRRIQNSTKWMGRKSENEKSNFCQPSFSKVIESKNHRITEYGGWKRPSRSSKMEREREELSLLRRQSLQKLNVS